MGKLQYQYHRIHLTFLLILSIQFSSFLFESSAYTPLVQYFINCGSETTVNYGGRPFVGDHSFFRGPDKTVEDSSEPAQTSIYQTARVFYRDPSSYHFTIRKNGTYVVRLHFCAFPSLANLEKALFDVWANGFTLLPNFRAPQGSKLVEEFLLSINTGTFIVYFIPSRESPMAFVNAIEVILAPDAFLSDDAPFVNSTGSNGNYSALLSWPLHKVHRLNVGGSEVTIENDILQRDWQTDDEFLLNPKNANNTAYSGYIYKGKFPSDFAPRSVYSTAKELDTNRTKQSNLSNITWGFPVNNNATHFVRVHFCDIVSDATVAAVKFNFHIYRNFSQKIDSSIADTNNLQTPFYLDYVVESDNSGFLNVTIDPRSESENQNAYLNGLEIMEVMTKLRPAPPERKPKKNGLSVILDLLAGGLFAVISVLAVLAFRYKRGKQDQSSGRPFSLSFLGDSFQNLQAGITGKVPLSPALNLALKLPYWEIRRATKNFSSKLFIGKGGFGKVFRATLRGREVAIKRLEPGHGQGQEEFHNEIMLLSKIRHRHLVSLIGYCDDRSEMILVYEYMEKGTLRDHLYDLQGDSTTYTRRSELSWQQRLGICIDSARGLHYLHTDLERKIIHRDVKSTNILLTENYLAKVADFGISKSGALDHDQDVNNTIKGSIGYIDPEYLMTLQLTEKSDVYSFGVVLLEVICARPVNIKSNIDEEMNLAEWGMHWQRKGELENIIDPVLVGKINTNSLRKFGETAEKCLRPRGIDRPNMRDVLWDLILALEFQMYEEVCEDSIINLSQEYVLLAAGHFPSQSKNFQVGEDDYDGRSFIMPSGVFSQFSNEHGR